MSSGQPSVENGHRPELNQVSSTSVSCSSSVEWQCGQTAGVSRATVILSQLRQCQAGNAMAPPELARDAPIADVLHPLKEDDLAIVGHKADAAAAHRFHGLFGQRLHVHEPLRRNQRLDDGLAAVALAEVDRVGLGL